MSFSGASVIDQLDSPSFPHAGQALTTQASVEDKTVAAHGHRSVSFDWRGAHSWAKNTLVLWLSGGSTVGGSQTNVRTYFPLGGFLNLSGVPETAGWPAVRDRATDLYRTRSAMAGEGILDVPAYIGGSLESATSGTRAAR